MRSGRFRLHLFRQTSSSASSAKLIKLKLLLRGSRSTGHSSVGSPQPALLHAACALRALHAAFIAAAAPRRDTRLSRAMEVEVSEKRLSGRSVQLTLTGLHRYVRRQQIFSSQRPFFRKTRRPVCKQARRLAKVI